MGVQLLLGDEPLLVQLSVSLQVELCVLELGPVARHLALRLSQLRFKRARIDLGQEVAVAHRLAFLKQYLHQLAVDPALHRHGIERYDRSEPVEIDADVPCLCSRDHDRYDARRLGKPSLAGKARLRLVRPGPHRIHANGQQTDRQQGNRPSLDQPGDTNGFRYVVLLGFLCDRRHRRLTIRLKPARAKLPSRG